MYLNVNLTTPSTGAESLSSTPKTPEILNSLISLTSSPLPPSYTSYQRQINREGLSPSSSNDSPTDEVSATRFGSRLPRGGSRLSPTTSEPSGKFALARSSRLFRGAKSSVAGTPSPPVPELPSPVSTVEATKTALIKEGLKHQITSKLQAAGVGPQTLLIDTTVKEEYSDSEESLTPQDEERRLRRRERNKIAATKCRNKKKERTIILMSESESVEDQNIRLKNEIQRLTSEKIKLEKLLDDPSHVASCRHSCGRSSLRHAPPLVVLTSPDAPELLSSTISELPFTSGVPPTTVHQDNSEQNLDTNTGLLYCSPNFSSSCESTFALNESSPTPSYQTLSSVSSISPCSVSNISPSQNFLPKNIPQTATHCSQHSNIPTTSYCTDATTILELSPSKNSTTCMSHPQPHSTDSYCYEAELLSTSSRSYHPIKSSPQSFKRNQPYSTVRQEYSRTAPYSGHSSHEGMSTLSHEGQSQSDYIPDSLLDESGLTNKNYTYQYHTDTKTSLSSDLSCGTTSQHTIVNCNLGKMKSTSHNRYTPYNKANRTQLSQPSSSTGLSQSVQNIQIPEEFLQQQSFDFQPNSNQFLTDLSNNNFYPPCTFGEL